MDGVVDQGEGVLMRASQKETSHEGGGRLSQLKEVDINLVLPDKGQPRKVFDSADLASLSRSLKKDGFLQPLVVRPSGDGGFYPLIAGERRLRAARALGFTKVPVVVKGGGGPESTRRLALIENIQRKDLGVIEEASAYRELIEEHGYTHEECARELGVDRTKVTNFLRILSLPDSLQASLTAGKIAMGHARALLSLKAQPGLMLEAHGLIVQKGLSVRQTEALMRKLLKERDLSESLEGVTENPNVEYMADRLRQKLKTKVRLLGSGVRGKIEISYFSPSEFERIISLFDL